MVNYIDLLSKPYKQGERGPDFYDCYGLVMEMYRRDRRVEVANYPTQQDEDKNFKTLDRAARLSWAKLQNPEAGCAVTFNILDYVHIGYMLTETEFIHTMKSVGVGINSVEQPDWKRRITGYYQWRGSNATF